MTYKDKYDAAVATSKQFQLSQGRDFTFDESEEFKASYIEGLYMVETDQRQRVTVAVVEIVAKLYRVIIYLRSNQSFGWTNTQQAIAIVDAAQSRVILESDNTN